MRTAGKVVLFLGFLLLVGVALFFVFRRPAEAEFGPATAVCPGPDQFGYTCTTADGYAYIDATQDTGLYEDDGMISLELPFPFTFYGATYTAVQASSNGNLQFANSNAFYFNDCLASGPLPGMGDLIAPFWDDLDLSAAGFLETEVVGATPNRVFVVEWDDVPRYGEPGDDTVTFAVQLFEGTNDVVFLYEDVNTLAEVNGRSATIGLQSEAAGLSLQFSCNQPAISDSSGLLFPFPAAPNADVGRETVLHRPEINGPAAKGEAMNLLTTLNRSGPNVLARLQRSWLSQQPQRKSEWVWVDLNGDGRNELILLWRGPANQTAVSELVVLTASADNQMSLWLDQRLVRREGATPQLTIIDTADLTGDPTADVLLSDPQNGYQFVLTAAPGDLALLPLPDTCQGSIRLSGGNGRAFPHIIRDGCATPGRLTTAWNGEEFVNLPGSTP